jgi:hypothetical protein
MTIDDSHGCDGIQAILNLIFFYTKNIYFLLVRFPIRYELAFTFFAHTFCLGCDRDRTQQKKSIE